MTYFIAISLSFGFGFLIGFVAYRKERQVKQEQEKKRNEQNSRQRVQDKRDWVYKDLYGIEYPPKFQFKEIQDLWNKASQYDDL